MARIVDYKVVVKWSEEEVEAKVKALIKDGWQPFGHLSKGHNKMLRQVMVKTVPEAEDEVRECKILTAVNWNVLTEEINDALKQGWKLKGLPYILDGHGKDIICDCCQVMVKLKGDCQESDNQE